MTTNISLASTSLTQPISLDRQFWIDLCLVTLVGIVVYGSNVDYLMRGDAATYADFALNAKFDDITLHTGYYVLVFVLDRVIGHPLGIPVHEMMVYLNVVAGALTLAVAYPLSRQLLGTRQAALVSVLILLLCGRMVMNATSSEIYMPQTFLVLLSFLFFAREHTWAAAITGGVALYISPLSAFAYLFYPVFDYQRHGRVRFDVLIKFAVIGFAVYLPFLMVNGNELFWGRRGLLRINEFESAKPIAALVNFPRFQFKHYTVLLLFLLPALLVVRQHLSLLALSAAVFVPHLYILLRLAGEDNVFILTTDFFFACWLALGWQALQRYPYGKFVSIGVLLAYVGTIVAGSVLFSFRDNKEYAGEMAGIARDYLHGRNSVMITDWDVAISLTYFGREHVQGAVEQDPLFGRMFNLGKAKRSATELGLTPSAQLHRMLIDLDGLRETERDRSREPEIFLLDPWEPSDINRLFSSEEKLERLRFDRSLRSQAERVLDLSCTLVYQYRHALYRCKENSAIRPGLSVSS